MNSNKNLILEENRQQLTMRGVDSMEYFRISALIRCLLFWLIMLPSLLATGFWICFQLNEAFVVSAVIVVSIIILFLLNAWAIAPSKNMLNAYENWQRDVIVKMAADSNAVFQPNGVLPKEDSEMIHHSQYTSTISSSPNIRKYNVYNGKNCIKFGNLRAGYVSVKHRYEEEHTSYKTDSEGKEISTTSTTIRVEDIFNGVVIIISAPLPAGTHDKDVVEIRDDGLSCNVKKIRIAHPRISASRYNVGATSEFSGHRTLTPVLQTAIWDYRNRFRKLPRFVYRNQLLYVGIPDIKLNFGNAPRIFRRITRDQLNNVITKIEETLLFLMDTEKLLKPA
jgi:hypothetical protein